MVMIIGGGIAGLTLSLLLHRAGIRCQVYEIAPQIRPLGAGINILPHAAKVLCELGLEDELTRLGVLTKEGIFFNRFGQFIYSEPLGRYAGYKWPQFSLHRADLQNTLLTAVIERQGPDAVLKGWKCLRVDQDGSSATAYFEETVSGKPLPPQKGSVIIACEGIHSPVRKQLYPTEGPPLYSGVNMWRGVAPWKPFLSGASMVRAGWLTKGKMVIYPIRHNVDDQGRQLVNWVVELETTKYKTRDWNRPGDINDFFFAIQDWRFAWLDVPALVNASEAVLEYPMVDQDPLPWWTWGRVTLLGDAAHPMYPRGSNGAGQAILDVRTLADCLAKYSDPGEALKAYEAERRPATAEVVRANRTAPPDAILREVYERTGDKPFDRIDDVITREEMVAITDNYKRVARYDQQSLR